MADRLWQQVSNTQCHGAVDLTFVLNPQTAGTPTITEGDPNGAYVTPGRTGPGVYTMTTKNPYLAVVSLDAGLTLTTPLSTSVSVFSTPVKNANNTWTFTLNYFVSGSAADITAGAGSFYVWIRMRNSTVLP